MDSNGSTKASFMPEAAHFDWYNNTGYINLQSERSKKLHFGWPSDYPVAPGYKGQVWIVFYIEGEWFYETEKKEFDNTASEPWTPIHFVMPEAETAKSIGKILEFSVRAKTQDGDGVSIRYGVYPVLDHLPLFTTRSIVEVAEPGVDGIMSLSKISGEFVVVHQKVPARSGTVTWQLISQGGIRIYREPVAFTAGSERALELKLEKKWFEYYLNEQVKCVSYWSFSDKHMAYWSEPQTIKVVS